MYVQQLTLHIHITHYISIFDMTAVRYSYLSLSGALVVGLEACRLLED